MFKPLSQIRINFFVKPQEVASQIRYFKKLPLDFDVFLPSIGKNLQRECVWTLDQKRELIWSMLLGRHIPHCAVMNCFDKTEHNKEVYLIIDGKQRLTTIFDFIDNKFTIVNDGEEYLFSQLPEEYQIEINKFFFRYYIVNEQYPNQITDDMKISWFKFINFAGTPQDKEHLENLK
jgi:hypothetical protein